MMVIPLSGSLVKSNCPTHAIQVWKAEEKPRANFPMQIPHLLLIAGEGVVGFLTEEELAD